MGLISYWLCHKDLYVHAPNGLSKPERWASWIENLEEIISHDNISIVAKRIGEVAEIDCDSGHNTHVPLKI